MTSKYQEHIRNYNIDTAISLLEEMFKDAIIDHAKEQVAKAKKTKSLKECFRFKA